MILSDTFTDADATPIQNHTAELGGIWLSADSFYGYDVSIVSNAAQLDGYSSGTGWPNPLKYNAMVMPTADYTVEAEYVIKNATLLTYYTIAVVARFNGTSALVGLIHHYSGGYGIDPWLGVKNLNGNESWGDTYATPVTNGTHRLKLTVSGSAAALYYDDVLIHEYTIATYPLPGPGQVGFVLGNTNTSAIDDIVLTGFTVDGVPIPNPFWTNLYGQFEIV